MLRATGLLAATLTALAIVPRVALTQSAYIWDGGDGTSPLWSTPANWNPDGAPANGFMADLTFGGTMNLGTAANPVTNDLTGGSFTNFTFSAGAGSFYLAGTALTNYGRIVNASGVPQTLNVGLIISTNLPANTNTHFIDVGTGSITNGGSLTAPTGNATWAKVGPGTLYFNSPLTNTLGNGTPGGATGYWVPAFAVDEGTAIFDGGPTSVYNMNGEGAFGRNAPTGNKNVTVIIQSGKVTGASWLAIGRGSGTGDVSSDLILNGSSIFSPVNWSGCYNSGDAAKHPRGSVVQNGTSLFWVNNNGNNNNFAESPGAYATHTVNDSATLQVGSGVAGSVARARIGISGRQVIKQTSPTATVTFGQAHFGDATGGTGAFYNRGIFNLMSPASVDHFSIGSASGGGTPANNSYGYYLNDTTTLVGLKEIGVGGSGGGNGVLEIRQGTVNVSNWVTICRSGGTTSNSAQTAMLMIRNGTLNVPQNLEQFRYLWSGSGITEFGIVDVGAGGKIGTINGANTAIDLAQSANTLSTSLLTLGGGGAVEIGRIFAAQSAPLTIVNFNGCTLSPTKAITGFLGANLDGVYVHGGGVTFDTKGFDITTLPQLAAPSDQGVLSIPVATPGAGYIGRAIVRITGGGGAGATAVANWDEASGTITGITVTCPGSGYFSAPTIDLIGGGFTTAATLGAANLGSVPQGGLTKTGLGTLTLTGGASYNGPTIVNGGTLSIPASLFVPLMAGPVVVSNATLSVDVPGGYYSLPVGAVALGDNAVLTFNFGTVTANPYVAPIGASGSLSAPGTNIVININGFGLQTGQFSLIKYIGSGPANLSNISLGILPPGVVATLQNNAGSLDLNISSAGQNLAWYGLLPDGLTVSRNWDIALTTNWVSAGSTSPALRYQEYTSAGVTVGDPVRFDDTLYNDFVNPPPTNINLTTMLRPYVVTVDSSYPYSFNGTGWLSGLGSVVKSNIGTLTIGTSNDYTGGTWLYGGSTIVSNDAALGASSSPLTLQGGGLQVNSNLVSTRRVILNSDSPVRVSAGMTAQFGGVFSNSARILVQDAGTVSVTNATRLQFHVQGGTLLLDGSARITNTTSYSSIGLGTTSGDNGTLVLRSNATLEINQDLNIADINDARGRLDIRDSAVLRTLNFWAGKNDTCTGLVYQAGGTLTNHLTGGTDWRLGGNDATRGLTTFGGYYLSGGRVDVQKNFQIGAYGTGELVISGGAVNQWAGYPSVGRNPGSIGRLAVSGGQFNQLNPGTFLIIGENGTGTLEISGTGVVNLTNAISIGGAGSGPGVGTATLSTGGLLITPGVRMAAAGTSTFNFAGGTLQANAGTSSFMQGLTTANILAGGAIIDTAGRDITIAQPLLNGGGGGGLTKNGAGTLTLSGACTYTGSTLVNTGRLFVAPVFAGTGPITVADGASFGVALAAAGMANVGTLSLGTSGATTLDFSLGTNSNPVAALLSVGSLTVNGTNSVRVAGRLSVGTFPLVKYTGTIGGAGFSAFNPVVNAGQGVSASLSNDASGTTLYVTVSSLGSGIVWTGTNSSTALTNLWDLNSTTNWLIGSTATTYQELVPPGDAVRFDDTGSGKVILSNSASPASLVFSNAAKAYTVQGPGRIAGTTGLTKQGAGNLTMSLAANDYSGDTVVSGGTFQYGNATAVPTGTGKGNLVANAGGTVDVAGWSPTVNGLAGAGFVNNSTSTNVVLTVGNVDSSSTWSGAVNNTGSGGFSFVKVGNGTFTLTGSNYLNAAVQAGAQVNGGALVIGTNGYLNSAAGEFWIAQNATTSSVVVAGGTLVVANNWIAIGRNNSNALGTLTVNSGTVVKSGVNNIVLGSLGATGILIVNGGQVLNSGMLWLGENATASGYLYLNGGLVQAAQVRPNGTAPMASVAYFNGGTLQASAASADFIQSTPWIQSKGLVLDDGGFAVTLLSQPLPEDPASPGGGVIKTGSGTVYFNTNNTYTGLTIVTNGTLGGIGMVPGALNVGPAGNVAPGVAGTTVGNLTVGGATRLNGQATFRIAKVGGVPQSDLLTVGSQLTYGGTLVLTNIGAEALAAGDSFTVFAAPSYAGTFSGIVPPSPGPFLAWDTSSLAVNGSIKIVAVTLSPPVITGITVAGTNVTITGTNGTAGQGFTVRSSMDVGAPLGTWSVIYSNWFGGNSFNFTFPINPAEAERFYRLSVP